jgi:ABC-type amino acid transport substrate-binding protein
MNRLFLLLLCAVVVTGCAAIDPTRASSTLDKIKAQGTITMGYREGAVPFSFLDNQKPVGYSVELCERIVEGLRRQLGLGSLKVNWVPATAENRIQQVVSGAVDLECGTTSMTLSRQEQVDFSLMTFLDGGAFLAIAGAGPKALGELKRARVAISTGTTTEAILRKAFQGQNVEVDLVPVKSHEEALALLREGKVSAYASDRTVLIGLALGPGRGTAFQISEMMFSYEPYGLMLRRDADFRLAVNRVLAGIYRRGEIVDIYRRWFGAIGEPSDLLKAMYLTQGLPE